MFYLKVSLSILSKIRGGGEYGFFPNSADSAFFRFKIFTGYPYRKDNLDRLKRELRTKLSKHPDSSFPAKIKPVGHWLKFRLTTNSNTRPTVFTDTVSLCSEHAKPEDAIPHNGTSYADIKAQCLKNEDLYEDPDFPAVDSSLFFSKKPPRPFVWKRPHEIIKVIYLMAHAV